MKVAIVSQFDFHLECIGFLCEILQEHCVTIYAPYDKYGYCKYFEKLFKNITIVLCQPLPSNIMSEYEFVIKLTSNDRCLQNPDITSILHLAGKEDGSNNYITLSPYVVSHNIYNMFPVFIVNDIIPCYEKVITFIGLFYNNWIDADMDFFFKHSNFVFNFIVWGDEEYDALKIYNNVSIFRNIQTDELANILRKSKFVLARKPSNANYDRFAGFFALSMSFKKPVLTDKRSFDAYKVPGIVFENEYSELIGKLDISDKDYDIMVENIDKFNIQTKEVNQNHMNTIIHKTLNKRNV